jgi:hypothetical protein
MDISKFKEALGDDYAALESYINELTGQRDAARKESVDGRKALKAKVETTEAAMLRLMEKLGVETLDELDALPPAKGQAEALKQLETRLKAKDAALAEKDAALSTLNGQYRNTRLAAELEKALAEYDFIDRDLVAAHIRQSLDWHDENLVFKTDKGDVPVTEGVKHLVAAKPHIVKAAGVRGSGYNPNARGAEVQNPWAKDRFNLTEQLRLAEENPALAAQLKAAAGTA